jgi:hypothetical protein
MRIRFRIGPFTFGRGGVRLSRWRRGSGYSIPLFNRKARSYGRVKVGGLSFYFSGKSKKKRTNNTPVKLKQKVKHHHVQAYEPWTTKDDDKLVKLYREGKTVKQLSEIFGRTSGAIRSRINKVLIQ